jgi:DNA-binding winged helix-turn-helix (wHTH) protein
MHRQKTSIYSETIEHPNFKVFSGRVRELTRLIREVTNFSPTSICIEGPTKIGASFLVNRMINLFKSGDGFWKNTSQNNNLQIQMYRFDCSPKTIKDVIDTIFEVVVSQENDLEKAFITDYAQRRLLLRQLLQNTPTRYVFCLLNFEETLKKNSDTTDVGFNFLSSLMDFQSFIFTIDRPITDIHFLANIKNIATLRLGLLDAGEAIQYLTNAFEKCKKVNFLSEKVENLLLDLSGCHPYLLYQISEVYYHACLKNNFSDPSDMDDQTIESILLAELHPAGELSYIYNFFNGTWENLSEAEKIWLKDLILQPEKITTDLQNEEIIKNLSFLQLISYNPTEKSFSISSRIFSEYIQIYHLNPGEETVSESYNFILKGSTNKEEKLFNLFTSKPNAVISNEEISLEVYGVDNPSKADIHKINTLVGRLRNRLREQHGGNRTDLINSVYGKGFRYSPPTRN